MHVLSVAPKPWTVGAGVAGGGAGADGCANTPLPMNSAVDTTPARLIALMGHSLQAAKRASSKLGCTLLNGGKLWAAKLPHGPAEGYRDPKLAASAPR
jgi:hypothetical protein